MESDSTSSGEEDEELYEVERILAERSCEGVKKFLVKWKGWGDVDSTWEPAKHFTDGATLEEWRAQLASGDFLDEEQVTDLEARIEAHTRDKESPTEHDRDAEQRSPKRQKMTHLESELSSSSTLRVPIRPPPTQPMAPRISSKQMNTVQRPTNIAQPLAPMKFFGPGSAFIKKSKPKKSNAKVAAPGPKSVTGNHFRTFRQLNEQIKRSKEEAAPERDKLKLRSVDEWTGIGQQRDTAQFLPDRPLRKPNDDHDSSLFVSDDEVLDSPLETGLHVHSSQIPAVKKRQSFSHKDRAKHILTFTERRNSTPRMLGGFVLEPSPSPPEVDPQATGGDVYISEDGSNGQDHLPVQGPVRIEIGPAVPRIATSANSNSKPTRPVERAPLTLSAYKLRLKATDEALSASSGSSPNEYRPASREHSAAISTPVDIAMQNTDLNPQNQIYTLDVKKLTGAEQAGRSKRDPATARFFIAFERSHPDHANLVRRELRNAKVSGRRIFMDGQDDWKEFLGELSKERGIIMFHPELPGYGRFPELGRFLGHDDALLCWHIDDSLQIEPVFPGGSLMLLTESAMINFPKESLFVLEWFAQQRKRSRSKYQLMLRPRIKYWLRQRALKLGSIQGADYASMLTLVVILSRPAAELSAGKSGGGPPRDDESLIGDETFEGVENPIVSRSWLTGYDDKSLDDLDEVLIQYFAGWASRNAAVFRRCLAVTPNPQNPRPNTGHIFFRDPKRFAEERGKS